MRVSRQTLAIYTIGVLMIGGLIGANRLVEARQISGDSFSVSCHIQEETDFAADQSCWVANRPAQIVQARAVCDTAASNVVGMQITHDEVVALTPEAAGAGADLLGRVRATVTPTGFFITDPAGLPQYQAPQDRSTSDGSAPTVVPGFVGIFNPTAVAGGETFFKPGDRLSLDFSAVPTASVGCTVNAEFVAR